MCQQSWAFIITFSQHMCALKWDLTAAKSMAKDDFKTLITGFV